MLSVFSIASSGMHAAELRLQASARNIANAGTVGSLPNAFAAKQTREPYQPLTVVQLSNEGGGVTAEIRETETPYKEEYSPDSPLADARGMVAAPQVDLAREIAGIADAKVSFEANALVLRAASDMFNSLLESLTSDKDDRRRWRATI